MKNLGWTRPCYIEIKGSGAGAGMAHVLVGHGLAIALLAFHKHQEGDLQIDKMQTPK